MPQITFCPTAPDRPNLHFDREQFAARKHYAVAAHAVAHGEFESTGISFDDYARMGVDRRRTRGERRLSTPEYALNERRLREVVIRYLEIRCHLWTRPPYTLEQRMLIASHLLKVRAEKETLRLDEKSREYVELRQQQPCTLENELRLRQLQRDITNLDTSIRVCREPWVVPQIVRLYYQGTLDAAGVAAEVGLKHAHVRQILKRLSDLADKIEAGTDFYANQWKKAQP